MNGTKIGKDKQEFWDSLTLPVGLTKYCDNCANSMVVDTMHGKILQCGIRKRPQCSEDNSRTFWEWNRESQT